jgi:hypothetical protein
MVTRVTANIMAIRALGSITVLVTSSITVLLLMSITVLVTASITVLVLMTIPVLVTSSITVLVLRSITTLLMDHPPATSQIWRGRSGTARIKRHISATTRIHCGRYDALGMGG